MSEPNLPSGDLEIFWFSTRRPLSADIQSSSLGPQVRGFYQLDFV
jgi:hypothetical protein